MTNFLRYRNVSVNELTSIARRFAFSVVAIFGFSLIVHAQTAEEKLEQYANALDSLQLQTSTTRTQMNLCATNIRMLDAEIDSIEAHAVEHLVQLFLQENFFDSLMQKKQAIQEVHSCIVETKSQLEDIRKHLRVLSTPPKITGEDFQSRRDSLAQRAKQFQQELDSMRNEMIDTGRLEKRVALELKRFEKKCYAALKELEPSGNAEAKKIMDEIFRRIGIE